MPTVLEEQQGGQCGWSVMSKGKSSNKQMRSER